MVSDVVEMPDIGAIDDMLAVIIGGMIVPQRDERDARRRPDIGTVAETKLAADPGKGVGKGGPSFGQMLLQLLIAGGAEHIDDLLAIAAR